MGFCVYRHTSPDGKVYIGTTSRKPNARWANGQGYTDNPVFYAAIQAFGWNNFTHEILLVDVSREEAYAAERYLIKQHHANDPNYGYNRHPGGSGANMGIQCSEECRRKRSEKMKGLFKGAFIGSKSPRARTICQYTLDGEYIRTWNASTEIQAALGIHYSNVIKCCTRNYKTAGGFIWLYEGDEDKLEEAVKAANAPKHISDVTKERIRQALIRYWHKTAEGVIV